jgi:hypothetical protein
LLVILKKGSRRKNVLRINYTKDLTFQKMERSFMEPALRRNETSQILRESSTNGMKI